MSLRFGILYAAVVVLVSCGEGTPTAVPRAVLTSPTPTPTPTIVSVARAGAAVPLKVVEVIPAASPTVATPTATSTVTATPEPTSTPTQTATPTATPTPESTATPTAVPTAIPTPAPTSTPTQTATPTATPTPESTATPTAVPTAIPTMEPPSDPTETPTPITAQTDTSAEGLTLEDLPWVKDGVTANERGSVQFFSYINRKDAAMGQTVLGFTWFADGTNHRTFWEWDTISNLASLFAWQPDLARRLLGFPWLADDLTRYESEVVILVTGLQLENSSSLAELLLGFPWLADEVSELELQALEYLLALPQENHSVAEGTLASPWIADGITEDEMEILGIVERVMKIYGTLVKSQPWYQDGLTDEEAALIVTLPPINHQEEIFHGLIEGGNVISGSISLPLAGEVSLYAVSRSPLQEDVLGTMRIGMEVIENYMRRPWSNSHVIALVEPEWDVPVAGAYHGTHITVKTSYRGTLYHELGHYYFSTMPEWLTEGGAVFLQNYTLYRTEQDVRYSPNYRRQYSSEAVKRCAAQGASNIQEFNDAPVEKRSEGGTLFRCEYPLGESFLLGMYEALGHDVVRASLQQLYGLRVSERRVTEDDIYQTLLSSTPSAKQDEFRDLYLCLHGRPIPGYTPAAVPCRVVDTE